MLCSICQQEIEGTVYTVEDHPVCGTCQQRVVDYQDRVEQRYDRLTRYADKLSQESREAWDRAHEMAQVIPFGQPILVGHHSEKADRRYRDRIHRTAQRGYEKFKAAEEASRRAAAAEKNTAISSDDPAAVIKLEAKIRDAEANQEIWKRFNAAVRKVMKMDIDQEARTVWLMDELHIQERTAHSLLEPDYMGRIGIPSWQLSNNSANIRRMKQRLEGLQKRAAAIAQADDSATSEATSVPGVTLERDLPNNRIRLYFPGKPAREVRTILKSFGFRWAPSYGAWQRYYNNSTEFAVDSVLKRIAPLMG